MITEVADYLRTSWPAAFVAIPCAGAYAAVLSFLGPAIEARQELKNVVSYGTEGPMTLLLVISVVLGYAVITILGHRLDISGTLRLFIGGVWWTAAIGGGVGVAAILSSLPDETAGLAFVCAGCAALAGVVRIWKEE